MLLSDKLVSTLTVVLSFGVVHSQKDNTQALQYTDFLDMHFRSFSIPDSRETSYLQRYLSFSIMSSLGCVACSI